MPARSLQERFSPALWTALSSLLLTLPSAAQVNVWKLGGSGLAWDQSDTAQVLIEFHTGANAIQPIYLTPDRSILSFLSDWSDLKVPRELGYVDGHRPRIWAGQGLNRSAAWSGLNLVDGDRSTYNATNSWGAGSWLTIDLGVPVPGMRFGFLPPSAGFRSDGRPLSQDFVPAYEVSLSAEVDPVLQEEDYRPLSTLVAAVQDNFDPQVEIEFSRQYVRFIRYLRKSSILDQGGNSTGSWGGQAIQGTIAEFTLYGEGAPRRVFYAGKIADLGQEVNFGRLFWATTPMRRVEESAVEAPEATAVAVELRCGLDEDPEVYHEFTDAGAERVVSRERYERLEGLEYGWDNPDGAWHLVLEEGKPGRRASVGYDTENWTFWSPSQTQSGMQAPLQRGRYLQVHLTLESQDPEELVRLDSLWLEYTPLLARRITGELARLDDLVPDRGVVRNRLGELTDFVYDVQAHFDAPDQPGFDALRLDTPAPARFQRLLIGEPLIEVAPSKVRVEADDLLVVLPERITPAHNPPIRLVFSARIFTLAYTFTGRAVDLEGRAFPQALEAGDVSQALGTNTLQVMGEGEVETGFIQDLVFSSPAFTPNGDGINDGLAIRYTLFRLPQEVPVELSIYTLSGQGVAHFELGYQAAGPQEVFWDGQGEAGEPVTPGLYLVEVRLRAETGNFRQIRPVGVVR
ncbi:MAG: hypothetical protein HYW07_01145 [Candidatus Latescibacteria bacterium]|nr:hypothetical protein [Candidatus Latescibacterota bacterium]